MRDREEVFQKFEEVRLAKIKERKVHFLSQCPRNCEHNLRMRVKSNGLVGFCQNQHVLNRAKTKLFVCDSEETPHKCGQFSCKNTEESVEEDFMDVLKSPARCGAEYPKLAMLIWFLQDYEPISRVSKLKYDLSKLCLSFWRIIALRWW